MRFILIAFALIIMFQPMRANAQHSDCATRFASFDDRERSVDFVRTNAALLSRENIVIVVLSGNRELQRAAYATALKLRDEGISLAIILGPSLDPYNSSAAIQVYAEGAPVSDGYGAIIGINNIEMMRPEILRMGRAAHDAFFPGRCES